MKKVLGLSALALLLGVAGASARPLQATGTFRHPNTAWYQVFPGAYGYYAHNFSQPSTPPIDPFHFAD